jgi:multidrug resistance protein MdtO
VAAPAALTWFGEFLKEELAPYPGRKAVVARMVIASTASMIATMVFRIPYGAQGAVFAFQVSRESQQASIQSAKIIVISFALAAADALLGALIVLGDPGLRVLWVIATLFMVFYALSALTNYAAALRFGFLLVIVIPVLDQRISAERKVEALLWAFGSLTLGTLITLIVELLLAKQTRGAELIRSIDERLDCVEALLASYAEGRVPDPSMGKNLKRVSTVGTSGLRMLLQRSPHSPHYREALGAVIGLVGELVNTASDLSRLNVSEDPEWIRALVEEIRSIRAELAKGGIPHQIQTRESASGSDAARLLNKMRALISMIAEMFAAYRSLSMEEPTKPGQDPRTRIFVKDALSNPAHMKFALRGCLAATLCYLIYNLVDWPATSVSLTACFLTALTTVGASRQKQALLVSGAAAGGLAGVATQLFILPYVDSILGFSISFALATAVAGWFVTCSPRLSFFGFQFAFAYNFVNLQGFTIQTSLTPARDRVAGILLGLFMMWLVFDGLGGSSAAMEMKTTFVSTLRLLAQATREPILEDRSAAAERSYTIRDTINRNFDNVRALADGVLFEFGPAREQNLAWRDRIRRWQPELRALFVLRIANWNYRMRLPGFELPEAIRLAQQEFDAELAKTLDWIADRLEGKAPEHGTNIGNALARLERVSEIYLADSQEILATRVRNFLIGPRRAQNVLGSLVKEM